MKTQSAFINPVTLPPRESWTPAEERFVKCMAQGEPCVISNEDTPAQTAQEKARARIVRAKFIRFFAYGGNDKNRIRGNIILLHGAFITEVLDLVFGDIPFALNFSCCIFSEEIMMMYAKCRALHMDGSRLTKGLTGDGMQVTGNLSLGRSRWHNFSTLGEISIKSATIGGNLSCDGTFTHDKKSKESACAFDGEAIKVGGDAFFGDEFFAEGEVNLLSADIGGHLKCRGCRFVNKEGDALTIAHARLRRSVFLGESFHANGTVRLNNTHIGGSLHCGGGEFINTNPNGRTIAADGITVNGNVLLINGFVSKGAMRFIDAKIGDNFDCEKGTLTNPGGWALAAERIKVGANIYLRKGFTADGDVLFIGANVGGSLHCDDGEFNGGMNIQSAKIQNSFYWHNISGHGTVDSSFAFADVLDDDKQSREGFDFVLNGFSYNRLANHDNVQSRINWLDNRPKGTDFSRRPFEQAAKVLVAMGNGGDARQVLFTMEQRFTQEWTFPKQDTFWSREKRRCWRCWRWIWEHTTGYNYLLGQMAKTAFAIFLAGWAVFWFANNNGHIVPHQPVVLANADYQDIVHNKKAHVGKCSAAKRPRPRPTEAAECLFPDYPRFNPFSFSADVFIPLFALHQEPFWYPQPRPDACLFCRAFLLGWYWFQVLAGWVLTSIFVLTITGILQQRQAGWGGK